MEQTNRLTGFRGFFVVWLGQFVSLIGTSMTRFGFTIWAFTETESATVLALVTFFSFGPSVILSPFAGALVDRWNRRLVMMAADIGAAISTAILLVLFWSGSLEVWHLYVAGFIGGAFESFQFPAFSAAVTMMVQKKDYARAAAMRGLAESASTVAAPLLAGLTLAVTDIAGVMVIDLITVTAAIGAVLIVHIPQPEETEEGMQSKGSIWREAASGFTYIWNRGGLLGMQLIFFSANLFFIMSITLLAPLVLASTGNDEVAYGIVQTAMGLGGVIGGIWVSVWGGPKRRVHGVFLGMVASSLLGRAVIGLGDEVIVWSIGAFLTVFFIPVLNGSNQAIWQAKVPPDMQGRVFAVRRLIAQIIVPFGMLIAGPLADKVFEPAMMPGGALASTFGGLVGTGPGAGVALIFVLTGVIGAATALLGYAIPVIRDIEARMPDYEPVAKPEPVPVMDTATADAALQGEVPAAAG